MKYLTAEQIAMRAERFEGRRNTAEINRLFRRQDQSNLWPVNNKFDATERAIRRVRKFCHDGGYTCTGLEYALNLDSELSRIVNDEVG
jgi:hypothetical protein